MRLNRKTREGILEVKGEIHKRTSVSSTGFKFKKMRIEVNILDYMINGVLSMKCKDGR